MRMIRAYEALRIEPVIDRVFPWTSAASALEYLSTGAHFGKVCLEI
jgi:NADPH:quinone reductase-like Zn-dependent oxidoreductase